MEFEEVSSESSTDEGAQELMGNESPSEVIRQRLLNPQPGDLVPEDVRLWLPVDDDSISMSSWESQPWWESFSSESGMNSEKDSLDDSSGLSDDFWPCGERESAWDQSFDEAVCQAQEVHPQIGMQSNWPDHFHRLVSRLQNRSMRRRRRESRQAFIQRQRDIHHSRQIVDLGQTSGEPSND
jgi:hypothetical protein